MAVAVVGLGLLGLAVVPGGSQAANSLPPAPRPPELGNFVQNEAAAIQLGKALFWDMQVGGDGIQACATCHFSAGTDGRVRATLNPKGDGFQVGGANAGPDYTLTAADFPFHRLSDPNDTHSAVLSDTNDVVGGAGVSAATFIDIVPGRAADQTDPFPMAGTRQVTGLNTPSVINAVFNHRNFWNGRAQFEFNGVNPFGTRDPNAKVLRFDPAAGTTARVGVVLTNASLASQAVGPPNNSVEMSANGRSFSKLGKKMLSLRPLGRQAVAADDSVLAGVRDPSGTGLGTSYGALVQAAFKPEWWASGVIVDGGGNPVASPTPGSTAEFTQMESNFSLFWGLAIQLYETQLVSDQTRFDQFLNGSDNALTSQEKVGFSVFGGKGQCAKCHSGPELTGAAVSQVAGNLTQSIGLANGGNALADTGWFNTGVRPTAEEVGIGGTDPFGNPLSEARRANPAGPLAVDGAVKTPALRNIELTGPYMHNGGMDTLEQVVDFYSRQGDFADTNAPNVSDRIRNLSLSGSEKAALVAFMKALTDERVRFERGPFDHPSIDVPQGNGPVIRIAAVGRNGRATALAPFPFQTSGGTAPAPPPAPAPAPNPPPAAPVTLLGAQTVQGNVDSNPTGMAEAFQYTAATSGTVSKLSVYLDGSSTASRVVVGLYADNAGNPGALLSQGSITAPVGGTFNDVTVSDAAVTAGQRYWIAVLAPSGATGLVQFRDVSSGGGATQTSAQSNLTALPASWSTGSRYNNSPMSAVAVQVSSGPAPAPAPPPADTTPPVLSLPGNITVSATGAAGAVVNYTATANDAVSGPITPACSVASGSTFPLGTTTVDCAATDAAGNTAAGSFTVTVNVASAAPVVLLGTQVVQGNLDSNPTGMAEAFQYTAATSGTVSKLSVYLDGSSTASRVVVGLYADNANNPGALLSQGTITAPVAGTSNEVAVSGAAVTAGQRYWIAVLAPAGVSGAVQFRDVGSGGNAQTSFQSNLTALPATWATGSVYHNSPLSATAQGN